MAKGRFVAYYRVSTARQGRSGLGLEGQQAAVRSYLNGGDWILNAELTEIESGKVNDRPALMEALRICKLTGATLVIAKLDRLSRDAHFLIGLERAGVAFVAVDMPNANKLTVGIMALVAEQEREAISARTKAALAAAKARGVSLGGWKGGPIVERRLGVEANQARAKAFVGAVGSVVSEMSDRGLSLRQIARKLMAQGIRTARAGEIWTADGVRAVLLRSA